MSNSLMANIEKIAVSYALSSSLPLSRSNNKGWVSYMTIPFLLLGAGLSFVTYGVYLWLSRNMTNDVAVIGTGLFAILVAGLCVLGRYLYSLYRFKRMEHTKNEIVEALQDILAVIEDEISAPVSEHPKIAMAASSVVGFIAGERIL